jgi:hypothetical protein
MVNYKGFIEHYFKIKNKEGVIVPFKFNNVQNVYYETLLKDYPSLKGIRENVLKARKEGFSSMIAGIFTTDFILSGLKKIPITSSQVTAHREADVKPHFNRINLFLESWLEKKKIKRKQFLVVDNQTSYIKNITGTEFSVGTAGAKAMGRGGDTLNLHWTEIGYFPNTPIINAEDLVIGAEKQVPLGLGKIFRESTGNVVGDLWNKEYWRGKEVNGKRESNFRSRFFPWFDFEEYQVPCPPGYKEFTHYENEMRAMYGLTNDQVYWYHLENKSVSDSNKFKREHPCNEREAFLSGGSCFFDIATLNWYLDRIKEPEEEGFLAPSGVFI